MRILKYLILVLFLWYLPNFLLFVLKDNTGSLLTYVSFILVLIYFYLNKKRKPFLSFIILGVTYFVISGFVNVVEVDNLIMDALKYFVLVICGIELLRNTTNKELFIILLIGAVSIFINAIYFQKGYGGRYSGFYLNPNVAGFICIVGYCLGYTIESKYLKLIGQFAFIFAGILTLSRTFIVLWVLVSIVAAVINKKNLLTVGVGISTLVVLLSISAILKLDTARFSALEGLLENKVDKQTITDDSRNETWSLYTDAILDNVLIGNGYKSMQGKEFDNVGIEVGVHNTYLMILGEAGFIPFLIIVFMCLEMFAISISRHFKENPEYSFLSFVVIMFLLTNHNFFDNFVLLIITIWLYTRIHQTPNQIDISSTNNE